MSIRGIKTLNHENLLAKPAKTVSIISNFLLKDQVLTPVGLLTRFKTVRTNIATEEIIVLVPATVQFLSDAKLLKKTLQSGKYFISLLVIPERLYIP